MSPERPAGGPEDAHVVRQGYLRRLKTMKRKYFVLKSESRENSARLEYYDSEKKFRARTPPKRAIPLKSCFNINRRLDTKHKHVIALYTKEEGFCVVLENEEELRSWLNALLTLHHGDEGSDEQQHPTQHVWLVNVQKRGLGASKNILGLYHLCLTEKTVSLWKIKANNNVLYDSCVPEHLEFSLKNIRRCGVSECFFYMEMGRQTVTGAGELWMYTDDSNIAQSMHTTIFRAMTNNAKENNDRDLLPTYRDRSMSANDASKPVSMLNRRQTHTGLKSGISPSNASINEPSNNTSLIGYSSERSPERGAGAGAAPRSPARVRHHRTVSLPIGCPLFSPPSVAVASPSPARQADAPAVAHARTRSLPLAGDDPGAPVESAEAPAAAVNGAVDNQSKKPAQGWLTRRASTGCRLAKWSPAHPKNGTMVRNRCDSMPSRATPRDVDVERVPSRVPSQHLEDVGEAGGSDQVDGTEWTPAAHRTPRIPEEPDQSAYCEMNMSTSAARETPVARRIPTKLNSTHHSRTSSLAEDATPPDGYLSMVPGTHALGDTGYVDMHASRTDRAASPAASGSSVASGTPSTDLRFSEYHLEPVSAKILLEDEHKPIPRAYSVGSRPTKTVHTRTPHADTSRTRAFSVGSKTKMRPLGHAPPPSHVLTPPNNKTSSAPLLAPRTSADNLCDDLMELDFSNNQASPRTRPTPVGPILARTPPTVGFEPPSVYTPRPTHNAKVDEYVDMSPVTPRVSGYVEMRPSDKGLTPTSADQHIVTAATSIRSPSSLPTPPTPDGYVEMNYGKRLDNRTPSRPILILSDSSRHFPLSRPSATDSERSTPSRGTPLLSPQPLGRNGSLANFKIPKKNTERQRRNSKDAGTPISAQTIFPFSLDSPASPAKPPDGERADMEATDIFEEDGLHYADVIGSTLSTVREISEDGSRRTQEEKSIAHSPPDYVLLKTSTDTNRPCSHPIAARSKLDSDTEQPDGVLLSSNPMATKTMTREASRTIDDVQPALVQAVSAGGAARFTPIGAAVFNTPDALAARNSSSPKPVESALNRALRGEPAQASTPPPLNYVSLDLEQRVSSAAPPSPTPASRTYTQIDFARSEKLNTVDSN